jgi:hypothetical protein
VFQGHADPYTDCVVRRKNLQITLHNVQVLKGRGSRARRVSRGCRSEASEFSDKLSIPWGKLRDHDQESLYHSNILATLPPVGSVCLVFEAMRVRQLMERTDGR